MNCERNIASYEQNVDSYVETVDYFERLIAMVFAKVVENCIKILVDSLERADIEEEGEVQIAQMEGIGVQIDNLRN